MKSVSDKHYVYLITNLINDKKYVGKSNNIKVRWGYHKKVAFGGKEKYPTDFFAVHAAIAKYGVENFKIEILEEFDSEDESYKSETRWIETYGSNKKDNGYNCNMGGKGGIRPTEETRHKLIIAQNRPEKLKLMSDLMKNRHKENPGWLGAINVGRISSEKQKEITSQTMRGSNHINSKLKDFQVLEIREKYSSNKYTQQELSDEYKISRRYVGDIVSRKTWRHI